MPDLKTIRLAIVRQKCRPDGGAERFISRALEALDDQNIELNIITRQWEGKPNPKWKIHLCNPAKHSRVSREKASQRPRKHAGKRLSLILFKAMNIRVAIFFAQAMARV